MRHLHLKINSVLASTSGSSRFSCSVKEFLAFGYKQALSCIFPVFILCMLAISTLMDHSFIARYDFLLIACLVAQVALILLKIESRREVAVIMIFHILGLLLELHKVKYGSWSYPEDAITKIQGVPLYSGFMYSSVASYICRAWDNFDLTIKDWPSHWFTIPIGAVIYLNFFSNAFIYDFRWIIIGLVVLIFRKTSVYFSSNGPRRKMSLLLSFLFIGFFIWLAENIATFLGAWKYASQHDGWKMVSYSKLTSWSLLVIVSVIIIGQLKQFQTSYKQHMDGSS
ncbi:MAG: uncharacterized membrane protein YoaT (DUF817 family) [Gammaproteobacteria bacterium]